MAAAESEGGVVGVHVIDVGRDFATCPGGRYRRMGENSAEAFREALASGDSYDVAARKAVEASEPVSHRLTRTVSRALRNACTLGSGTGGSHSRVSGTVPQRDYGLLATLRVLRLPGRTKPPVGRYVAPPGGGKRR